MEGPRDPKLYREPELDTYPPKLGDVVGVFSGYSVKTRRLRSGELELVVQNGGRIQRIRV